MYMLQPPSRPQCLYWPLILLLMTMASGVHSQEGSNSDIHWSAAIRLQYYIGWNTKGIEASNHFTLGTCFGITFRRDGFPLFAHLQSGANIYANGLGTNIVDNVIDPDVSGKPVYKRRKLEVDFVNTALLNFESGGMVDAQNRMYLPIQHFNHMTPYVNNIHRNFTFTYGINYIFNTSHRNQNIAFLGLSSPWVSLGMYNDGSAPFYLGDQYDRFWTGGGYLRINPLYNASQPTAAINEYSLEYNFHRFTYDVQDEYRVSNLLGFPQVQGTSLYDLLYNNSLITVKLNWRNAGVGMSWLGKSSVDIQDFIHETLGYPIHYTYKQSERLLHISYLPTLIR